MTEVEKEINFGGIRVCNQFLDNKSFDWLDKKVKKLKYIETYQPKGHYYGNRYQAYPCYENSNDLEISSLMRANITSLFGRQLKDFNLITRKTKSDELQKSKVNTPFGLIHSDDCDYASILYFDQTVSGGTCFFEYQLDKYPDITVGAYPNRFIAYSGRRPHAPAYDYTFKERYIVATFWN